MSGVVPPQLKESDQLSSNAAADSLSASTNQIFRIKTPPIFRREMCANVISNGRNLLTLASHKHFSYL